jgi:hypothetical protein
MQVCRVLAKQGIQEAVLLLLLLLLLLMHMLLSQVSACYNLESSKFGKHI